MTRGKYWIALATMTVLIAACGDESAREFDTRSTEIITEPGMEEVQVQVPTVDTFRVEREVETTVDVDTHRIRGGVENMDAMPRRSDSDIEPAAPNY